VKRLPTAGQGTIWHGDCLDLLRHVPGGSVSLICTSPPYPKMKGFDLDGEQWLDWFVGWADTAVAAMKPNGVFVLNIWFGREDDGFAGSGMFEIPRLAESLGLRLLDTYIYAKPNPAPNGPLTYCDPPGWEPIWVFTNARDPRDVTFNPYRKAYAAKSLRANGAVYTTRSQSADAHPKGARQTTLMTMSKSADQNRPKAKGISFPRDLPRRFIGQYTNPGELVLDPFAGVGTTVRVAVEMGRAGLGIEIDEDEAAKAREWIAEPMQGSLLKKVPDVH
jgi:site-specific DNA-methyltransferase (cytosine-N4-specific)